MNQKNQNTSKYTLVENNGEDINELFGNYRELRKIEQLYEAAMKQIETRVEILSSEFAVHNDRNASRGFRGWPLYPRNSEPTLGYSTLCAQLGEINSCINRSGQ